MCLSLETFDLNRFRTEVPGGCHELQPKCRGRRTAERTVAPRAHAAPDRSVVSAVPAGSEPPDQPKPTEKDKE